MDAYRSTIYIAVGFVKRNFVENSMYSTLSMLRTIELILEMPPITKYDAAALLMFYCFQEKVLPSNFLAITPTINLIEKNIASNYWQQKSDNINFVKEDALDDNELNKIL